MTFNDLTKATELANKLNSDLTFGEREALIKILFNHFSDEERSSIAFFLISTGCVQQSDFDTVQKFNLDKFVSHENMGIERHVTYELVIKERVRYGFSEETIFQFQEDLKLVKRLIDKYSHQDEDAKILSEKYYNPSRFRETAFGRFYSFIFSIVRRNDV